MSGRRASQWARVLFELRQAGPAGITTNYIRNGMAPPIANPSQRILELEAQGHVISSTPERQAGRATVARYRLEHDAGRPPVGVPSGGPPAEAVEVSDSDTSPQESFEVLLAQLGQGREHAA